MDFHRLSLKELEALCDKNMLELIRHLNRNDLRAYRQDLEKYLAKPKLPIDDGLAAVRAQAKPNGAWNAVLDICRRSAPSAVWRTLPSPNLEQDIEDARTWLSTQLQRLPDATGIYLGLDTLNMNEGFGKNVELGGTSECDPYVDSQDWVYGTLNYGKKHLIRGLVDMQSEYSKEACVAIIYGAMTAKIVEHR